MFSCLANSLLCLNPQALKLMLQSTFYSDTSVHFSGSQVIFLWFGLGMIASSHLWLDFASVLYNSDLRIRLFCVHTSHFTWTWQTHVLNISCFLTKIITQEYQIRSTDYKTSLCIIFNNRNAHPNNDTVVHTQSDVECLCLPHLRFRMCMCMYVH